ncbi:hypothetical protein L1987_76752 [Smallanthus sonchifolius]|uniref:Uncharacterized protein n=1 Tax=Smallanthus sonchifolius TaxID=185202 RepID=A0ACB8Z7W3_9ASTR|nr:hypothetical protein L1987_76752 [Smallanthus sonchifolius]
MDPEDDKRSVGAQVGEVEEETESSNEKKCCTDCRTTRTPLWRGGPAGPKSLCNACGIKYNKKRRAQMCAFDKNGRSSKITKRNGDLKLKVRLMVTNHKQPHHHNDHDHDHEHRYQQQQQWQRKRSSYERGKPWWNKLREEEQAAILLMALSCGGSLYS